MKKGWSLPPMIRDADDDGLRSASNTGGGLGAAASLKGKGKSVVEAMPPPQVLLGENRRVAFAVSGEAETWRRFREAGLLDESSLQRKDRDALVQRIAELENELHQYQYNMGLLLIEKKELVAKCEELTQDLAEAREIVKREQISHFISLSEYQKREENFQKDLGFERKKVADLKKDFREVCSEIAEVKFTSGKKLAEAEGLEAGLEEKYLEIKAKAHGADAKLAEANRKISEINRKLDGIETRERKVQKEYLSLTLQQKAHEEDLNKQREYLFSWEKRLQDSQKRLAEGQRLLNEREDRVNELDMLLKQKQAAVKEAEKVIIASKKSLKSEEEALNIRLCSLASPEKVEIQKLLDDHNATLDPKKREIELEMHKKREASGEEVKTKLVEVEEKKKGNQLYRGDSCRKRVRFGN